MNILGLDLSLSAPGIASHDLITMWTTKLTGAERLSHYRVHFDALVAQVQPDVAVIEGYAFNSPFNREALAELGGVVRMLLFERGVPTVEIAPATVKKYATGNGRASKDEVLAAAIKRSGLDINNNNVADAWWLYQMGCAKYGVEQAVDMPALNRKSLSVPKWPAL